jgi:hypothetical protein
MKYGIKSKLEKLSQKFRLRWYTTRFFFDKPKVQYQPLPWCGIEMAKRDTGSRQRLKLIKSELGNETSNILDVGSSVGFFSISLAENGSFVTGLEMGKDKLKIAQCAAEMAGVTTVSFVNMKVTTETVQLLPTFNVTLCLSIWHHWVRYFGLENANVILNSLWEKTTTCLFFDTGLTELPEYFNFPELVQDPEKWLVANLQAVCPGGEIKNLGQSYAFPAEQFLSNGTKQESSTITRNLYCIKR